MSRRLSPVTFELTVCAALCPIGGRFSRRDGEGLPPAHLPPEPPLSVEEAGPAQEETSGLVSVCVSSSAAVEKSADVSAFSFHHTDPL